MPAKIYIQPESVWPYFMKWKRKDEDDMECLATNDDYGVEIYASCETVGEVEIAVLADDEGIFHKVVYTQSDCETLVSELFDSFLTSKAVEMLGLYDNVDIYGDDEEKEVDEEHIIEEREDDLDILFWNLVDDVCGDEKGNVVTDEMVDDVKEKVLGYLARKYRVKIYRPMYLIDNASNDLFFAEYPYEFLDSDN